MKKYDCVLLALYALLIASLYGLNLYFHYQKIDTRKLFKEVVENQDILRIVIENVGSDIEIFYAEEGDPDTWRVRGSMNQHDLASLYVEDQVLHIKNIKSEKIDLLKVRQALPIEIINSPNVKILSEEELAERKNNPKVKAYYEL